MVKRGFICSFFVFLLSIGITSSTLQINDQPSEVYNYGDIIQVSVLARPESVSGSFEINLVCGEGHVNFYKISPAESSFTKNVQKKIDHKIILTKEYLDGFSGSCFVESKLGEETTRSNNFFITDEIFLDYSLDAESYSPGDKITVTLNARKANGLLLNGGFILSGEQNLTGYLKDGFASIEILVPEETPAGKYLLDLFVYDGGLDNILNQNKKSFNYYVQQVPTNLDIQLDKKEAVPNDFFYFSLRLRDQTGQSITEEIELSYLSPNGKKEVLVISSDDSAKIFIEQNSIPGEYTLSAKVGNLVSKEIFSVIGVANISIQFSDELDSVFIKNIGNIAYKDELQVYIGEENRSILVNLKVGEEKRYSLSAPSGEYNVFAEVGNFSSNGKMSLTGRVVSVGKWGGIDSIEEYPFAWIFIVIVLLILGIMLILKTKHLRTFDYSKKLEKNKKRKEVLDEIDKKPFNKKSYLDFSNSLANEAKFVPALKGDKNYSSVISLNIKNYFGLGENSRKFLSELVMSSKDKKSAVEIKGSYLFIIYSPLITKTFNNEILASRVAWKIKKGLDEFNKKFRDKISYGIGLNSGDMVSSLANGKLLYTNLGNGVILAKRLSDINDEKILASDSFRQKLMRELKVKKTDIEIGSQEVFEVLSIEDTEKNQDKLKNLLKRIEFSMDSRG